MTGAPAIVPNRKISGASAVLMTVNEDGSISWSEFEQHLERTVQAGLAPAVNMDTGFGPYLTAAERTEVLTLTKSFGVKFIAGVHLDDQPGDAFNPDALLAQSVAVAQSGAVPILFPSHGLSALSEAEVLGAHELVATEVDAFLGFELGPMFHPAGRIYSADMFEGLLGINAVVGLKHSSLRRDLEWERLELCKRVRPDFQMMTGNDLAIDMVIYGSDYLLGLSTFSPAGFAARDAAWEAGDTTRFWELNDLLQYLGQFAFRPPVPGYRHDAAMFLQAQGLLDSAHTHPLSPKRPSSDAPVLEEIAARLSVLLHQ
jgi:dihydrodipicolinate synthase/N-acetylneuraminate lyase